MLKSLVIATLALAVCLVSVAGASKAAEPSSDAMKVPGFAADIFPPWQDGQNNDATDRGLAFTVPEIDDMADFHGDLTDPKLVLFVGGNYYFAMAPLVKAFEASHPEYKGRLFWETIPPGLLVDQMKAHDRITVGNMTFVVRPDAYFAGLKKVQSLIDEGLLEGPPVPYVTNTLTIMVPKVNPAKIDSLQDLGKAGVRLAMPNPEFEGVARQIKAALAKAGGDALADAVYGTKVKDGSTTLTHIHHRQTPLFLMQSLADAGVTWKSEALFQEQAGHPIAHVDIPENENVTAVYAGAVVKGSAHGEAAKAWLEFIHSPEALSIFERYGFEPYTGQN
jgi:ABC-type molybdate transport system substrate-binding protein